MNRWVLLAFLGCTAGTQEVTLPATVETDPVPHEGDAADDPAVWVHPKDPARSTIIGTDKRGGLAVYGMDGKELQYLKIGRLNNADVRYGFPLGGATVDIVAASEVDKDALFVFRIDPESGKLSSVTPRPVKLGISVYGCCLYRSAKSGKFYFIGTSYRGPAEQWELFDDGAGNVDARRVRRIEIASSTEGCVADDELGHLYIGEEREGIWKYGAEPDAGEARVRVDTCGRGGHIVPDVEGLAICHGAGGKGYLLASSQGDDSFVIYRREGANEYLGTFKVGKGTLDGVSDCDGIEVTNSPLGPGFPSGVFVAQDGSNDRGNQNFKLVPWPSVAGAFKLEVGPGWNPRAVR